LEESLKQLWTFCLWFAGISTTAALFIGGWMMKIHSRIGIGEMIEKDLKGMAKDVNEIKVAMVGDFDKPGLLRKHYELEQRVKDLEDKT
jgi:hypothetical protein